MGSSHRDIEAKKAELEYKLRHLEGKLDERIENVKNGVTESLSVKKVIRRHPLPAVALSVIVGLLAAKPRIGKKSSGRSRTGSSDDVLSVFGKTLKKRLTQKAIDSIMDIIEEQIARSDRRSLNK